MSKIESQTTAKLKNTTAISNNWIPVSNLIFEKNYRKYDSTEISVLLQSITRIHNFNGKTYTQFSSLSNACKYFGVSKKPLLKALTKLQEEGILEFEYHRRGHLEITLNLERPHSNFTKYPVELIKEAQKKDLTPSAFSLYMFLIFKYCRPFQDKNYLSLKLDYLAKVIQSSTKTVKNSLNSLIDNNLVNCVFAKFQTHDPCIITPLYFTAKSDHSLSISPAATTSVNAMKPANSTETKGPKTKQEIQEKVITPGLSATPDQLNSLEQTQATLVAPILPEKTKTPDQIQSDLERVLKRHNRDQEDATLVIKFLTETSSGLDKKPIRSMPALWEKDLQSELKILQFRFVEWKHQQEKEESRRTFANTENLPLMNILEAASTISTTPSTQNTIANSNTIIHSKGTKSLAYLMTTAINENPYTNNVDISPAVSIDRSEVKFCANIKAESGLTNTNLVADNTKNEMTFFSFKPTKISNQSSNFPTITTKTSNNIRDLEIRNINNHIKGEIGEKCPSQKLNNPHIHHTEGKINNRNGDCDSFNFSSEELEVIGQYKADALSARLIKPHDFVKRYLDIGVELLRTGRKINLENISALYSEKNKSFFVTSFCPPTGIKTAGLSRELRTENS